MFELEKEIRLAIAEYKKTGNAGDSCNSGGGMNNPTESVALREICEVKKVTVNGEVITYPERWITVIEKTYSSLSDKEKQIFREKMRGIYYKKIYDKYFVSEKTIYNIVDKSYVFALAAACQLGLVKVL